MRGAGVPAAIACLALTLALLVPALVNRGVFLFPDTTAYVRGADGAVLQLTGRRSAWSDRLLAGTGTPAAGAAPPAAPVLHADAGAAAHDRAVLAGRSIYYGALLYLALLARSFWPLAVLQAAIVAAAMTLTVRRFVPAPRGGIAPASAAGLAAVALLTPAGFYAGFAMPDIFAAAALLASAHAAVAWARAGAAERAFWLALLAAGALFHSATLLILAALAGLLALARWRRPAPFTEGRLWPLLLALAIGIGGEALFSAAVTHATGSAPLRPPFLTARLIDDGPGMAYLRVHCGERDAPVVCRYRARLPMPSDAFLWSSDPAHGVFKSGSLAEQRALASDETRFVGRVATAAPAAVLGAMLRDAARQAVTVGLGEFDYDSGTRAFLDARVPDRERRALRATAAWSGAMPTAPVASAALPLALLSLAAIGWAARRAPHAPAVRCALWLVAAVLLNAAVCGALSGPHDRYGARVVWLLPLGALVALAGTRRTRAAA